MALLAEVAAPVAPGAVTPGHGVGWANRASSAPLSVPSVISRSRCVILAAENGWRRGEGILGMGNAAGEKRPADDSGNRHGGPEASDGGRTHRCLRVGDQTRRLQADFCDPRRTVLELRHSRFRAVTDEAFSRHDVTSLASGRVIALPLRRAERGAFALHEGSLRTCSRVHGEGSWRKKLRSLNL
jgi:hypothetical protein